jgi:hypothetical protein
MAQATGVNSPIRALAKVAETRPPKNICGAHAEFVALLARIRPRPIPVSPNPADLEERADHLSKVFAAVSFYLTAILQDTAQNVPGGFDLRYINALRSDLESEVSGTLQQSIESAARRVA